MNSDFMPFEAARVLDRAFHLAGGDTHKSVDLQKAWLDLDLPAGKMRDGVVWLVENHYLLPAGEQSEPTLHLTEKAIKRMASIKTRR